MPVKYPAGTVMLLPAASFTVMSGDDSLARSGNVYVVGLTGRPELGFASLAVTVITAGPLAMLYQSVCQCLFPAGVATGDVPGVLNRDDVTVGETCPGRRR